MEPKRQKWYVEVEHVVFEIVLELPLAKEKGHRHPNTHWHYHRLLSRR
jgi:hypothetical protein